ncbi:MAG: nucleotidyltransferase domain-containing protein [Anaerolineales bacterium]|nr:nucleotidyltransferase domain-containing protein [Anaerolineales bacterium]
MQPKLFSNGATIISLDRKTLLAQLRKLAQKLLAQRQEVQAVYLFGSLARGDYTGFSDIDLLVILRESQEPDPIQRLLLYLPFFCLERGVDLLVYTEAEWKAALEAGNPFLKQIWEEKELLDER